MTKNPIPFVGDGQRRLWALIAIGAIASSAFAAGLKAPKQATAGEGITITAGDGGDLLLFGPGGATKRKVSAGDVRIPGEDVRAAGRYMAILDDASAEFSVVAAKPSTVNFLARPSRVPVSRPDAISGVAFVFDDFQNLVQKPAPVKFDLSVKENAATTRTVESKNGIAFTRLPSANKEGAAQFVASVAGGTPVRRVVQQVASDACDLRMKAQKTDKSIIVETDPIKNYSETLSRRHYRHLHRGHRQRTQHGGCAHQARHRTRRVTTRVQWDYLGRVRSCDRKRAPPGRWAMKNWLPIVLLALLTIVYAAEKKQRSRG